MMVPYAPCGTFLRCVADFSATEDFIGVFLFTPARSSPSYLSDLGIAMDLSADVMIPPSRSSMRHADTRNICDLPGPNWYHGIRDHIFNMNRCVDIVHNKFSSTGPHPRSRNLPRS